MTFLSEKFIWIDDAGMVKYYNLKTQKEVQKLKKYAFKTDKYTSVQACSPHQMARTSHKRSVDEKTMLSLSNRFTATIDDQACVFDFDDQVPRLIKTMTDMSEHQDPENHVENGFANLTLQPNNQGTIIVKTDIYGKMQGIYKLYSRLDQLRIKDLRQSEDSEKHFSLSLMLNLFGEETAIEALSKSLQLLNQICAIIESLDLGKDLTRQNTNANRVRLANILIQNTRVVGCETKEQAELSSLLHANLDQPGLRDILTKIGRLCGPTFSIFKALKDQADFKTMVKSSTAQSTEELNQCFEESIEQEKIVNHEWPDLYQYITFTSEEIEITNDIIKTIIKEKTKNDKV